MVFYEFKEEFITSMFIRDLETDSQIEKYKSFTDNTKKNDT